MDKQIIKIKKMSIYLSLAVILAISVIAIPMQPAQAQRQQCPPTTPDCIVVRLVGAISQIGQAGLINVAVGNVIVPITVSEVLSGNTVVVPVNVQANVPVTVCAVAVNVLGASGPQTCRTVNDAMLENDQIVTLPVRPPA